MHYIAAAQTDIGNTKAVNQDSLMLKVADTPQGELAYAVLCDGMGGLESGQVASAAVVRAYEKWFNEKLVSLFERKALEQELRRSWYNTLIECNEKIIRYSSIHGGDMGTTLTAAIFFNDNYYIMHVGDCRVYEMLDTCEQLTYDQTFVAREVALGHMTSKQALSDPRRNVLLQCVGVNHEVKPDFIQGKVSKGASYLICSDGFRHELTAKEIYSGCHEKLDVTGEISDKKLTKDSRKSARLLMEARLNDLIKINKQRKERDNISAILIKTY